MILLKQGRVTEMKEYMVSGGQIDQIERVLDPHQAPGNNVVVVRALRVTARGDIRNAHCFHVQDYVRG